MDINNFKMMDAKREVKILLSKRAWTLKHLAEKMSEISGKYYSQQNLNYRLSKNMLKLWEMSLICYILNVKIDFVEL